MDPATRARLINLLARTTSEHDGEALAAAKKANQLLERHGLTWAEVISAARPTPPAGGPTEAARSAGPRNPMPRDGDVGSSSHYPKPHPPTQHRYLTPRQRIARGCLRYGLGSGLLTGAAITLYAAIGDDGLVSDYELAGVVFVLPALLGFVLWVLLGGWLPEQRIKPR